MKVQLRPDTLCNEKYYHLYLNGEHIGYQNKVETIKKIIALIRMSDCEIELSRSYKKGKEALKRLRRRQ